MSKREPPRIVVTDQAWAIVLLMLAGVGVLLLGLLDNRSSARLLPSGSFRSGSVLSLLYACMFLLQVAVTSDIYVPLLLQDLHGQPPLAAGYLTAIVAVGWTVASMSTSGWTEARALIPLRYGPALMLLGLVLMAVFMPQSEHHSRVMVLVGVSASLLLMGLGVGAAWPHLLSRVLKGAPAGEQDITSASITMVQLFASGLGAAFAGVVVNLAGIGASIGQTQVSAAWLFGLFALAPLLALMIAFRIGRA